jgi:hypothetical protein
MGHVSQLLSLASTMHVVTKPRPHGILWPYKSQRKATYQRSRKHEKMVERKKMTSRKIRRKQGENQTSEHKEKG